MCHKQMNREAKGLRITGAKKPCGTFKRLPRAEGEGRKGKAIGDNTVGGLSSEKGSRAWLGCLTVSRITLSLEAEV